MSEYGAFPQTLGKMMRDAFGEPARVDEDQRRAMSENQFTKPIVDLAPHLIARDGAEFVLRHFDCNIQFAAMTAIDNADLFVGCDKASDFFDRPHRGGKADTLQWRSAGFHDEVIETDKR